MNYLAKASRRALTISTVIAFSLTFALAGLAVLLGWVPFDAAAFIAPFGSVEAGVVLLMVPLVALVLAILFEAVRLTLRGPIELPRPQQRPSLSPAWQPGNGEG